MNGAEPALAPAPAPASQASSAPAAAKQTILGVSMADVPVRGSAVMSDPHLRPTAQGTAVPEHTIAGTSAAGSGARRYVAGGVLAPGTVVGEYHIEAKIGEGGMGVVYSAMHPMIGKRAAIKVIGADLGTDPVVVQRFVQEARSVNQIGHPNIVDVFAFGQLPDGRNYFVMEYLQGESLRSKLTRMFVPLADTVQILDEIAGALEAAHEKQIVHRDLKPDNVYLATVRGGFIRVKLLDFGIAKLVVGDGGIAKTNTGEMIGTPAYLSPEQARGKNVDYRTDIYALGCMMFEMITGRLPFMAESAMDIVLMHISKAPQRPSELSPGLPPVLDNLIMQMLEKQPERRPSLADVRAVFAELVASGLVQIEPGSGATFRSDLARRRGDTESRTPPSASKHGMPAAASGSLPAAPVVPAQVTTAPGRRRTNSPSDAPTGIAFNPGPDTLTPSDKNPTMVVGAAKPKSRKLVAIAIVVTALSIPTVTIVLAMANRGKGHLPLDAAAIATAPSDAISPADAIAAVTPATIDAGAGNVETAVKRAVTIKTNVPTAKIEVDGAPVDAAGVSLTDGPHHLVINAPGRTPIDKTIDVSASSIAFDYHLERAAKTTSTPTPTGTPTGRGSATPTLPAGSGSGSANKGKDEAIDPFAQ